jgi:hypothetical protein
MKAIRGTDAGRVPLFLWVGTMASTLAMAGLEWDVSWHRSIGRDTSWSPPHLLIYASAAFAGMLAMLLTAASTWRAFTSFVPGLESEWTSSFAGLRSPLGSWVLGWGCLALLTSVPFDNWWHQAYGLDVKILSPPHLLFGTGLLAIEFGTLLLLIAFRRRTEGLLRGKLTRLFIYDAALIIVIACLVSSDYLSRIYMHSSVFYLVASALLVVTLVAFAEVAGGVWSATWIASVYMVFVLIFTWGLPLFSAFPRLGPIYQPVTHMTAPEFPLLLIVPAAAIDLARRRFRSGPKWAFAFGLGVCFLAALLFTQWPFATFLMSPASRNWIFATNSFGFDVPSGSDFFQNHFAAFDVSGAALLLGLLASFGLSSGMAALGLIWAGWLGRVHR